MEAVIAAATPSNNVVSALVAFLRHEADVADQNAHRLREQAAQLAEEYGVSDDMQDQYELDPEEMPPLDEHGVPKYRGKKRGRKPKKRKRKINPQRGKRQHTAYTLFVQTNYPSIRAMHPELPSKNVISVVARQWANVSAAEKVAWKERALATHDVAEVTATTTTLLRPMATATAATNRNDAAALSNINNNKTDEGLSAEDVLAAGVEAGVVDPDDVYVEDDDDDDDDEEEDDGDEQQRHDEDADDDDDDNDDDQGQDEEHGAEEDDDDEANVEEENREAQASSSRASSANKRKGAATTRGRQTKKKTMYS